MIFHPELIKQVFTDPVVAGPYNSLSEAWVEQASAAKNEDPVQGQREGLPAVARIAELEWLGVTAMERWLSTSEPQ